MRFALLEQLPERDVQQVISIARRRRFARGEIVFHQGETPADTLHLIVKGKVAVRVATSRWATQRSSPSSAAARCSASWR